MTVLGIIRGSKSVEALDFNQILFNQLVLSCPESIVYLVNELIDNADNTNT